MAKYPMLEELFRLRSNIGYAPHSLLILKPDTAIYLSEVHGILNQAQLPPVVIYCGIRFDRKLTEAFYPEHVGKDYFEAHATYMESGPIVAIKISAGVGAIKRLRALVGSTNPAEAAEGTLRRMYGKGLPNNGFHASDSSKSFHREWALIRKAFTH
jgi:nucleoside-diphosphate kinase